MVHPPKSGEGTRFCDGHVRLIEPLGDRANVHVVAPTDVGGASRGLQSARTVAGEGPGVVVRVAPDVRVEVGQRVAVDLVDPQCVHLFHADERGQRLA